LLGAKVGLERFFGNFLNLNEKIGSYLWAAKEPKRIGFLGFGRFGDLRVRKCLALGMWPAEAKTSCFGHFYSVGPGALLGTEHFSRNFFDNCTILELLPTFLLVGCRRGLNFEKHQIAVPRVVRAALGCLGRVWQNLCGYRKLFCHV
jgi:hypothetical protein